MKKETYHEDEISIPIKVRLELVILESFVILRRIFQFHKGAIRTSGIRCEQKLGCYNFNSIKVRLELTLGDDGNGKLIFQFHKGAIRTKDSQVGKSRSRISIP